MKNEKIYTLRTIRRMLDLADHFISYEQRDIFRESGNTDALQALKEIVLSIQSPKSLHHIKWKKSIETNIANIKQKINAFNASTKPQPVQVVEAIEQPPAEKVTPISSFDWANLYKHLIQHGKILDNKSLEVNASWHIFLHQLRRLQNAFASQEAFLSPELTQNLSEESELLQINKTLVRDYFLKFLGQLCLIGHSESAKVIHNYIYLSTKVLEGQRAYGMTEVSTGSMVLSVLLAGLDLSDMIVLPVGDLESRYLDAQKAEHKFFPKLTPILIAEPTFAKPFDLKMYENYHQESQFYSSTLDNLTKLVWRNLPGLRVPVGEVEFQSPREHQALEAAMHVAVAAGTELKNRRHSQDKKSGVLNQIFKKLSFNDQPTVIEGASTSARGDGSHRGSPHKGGNESPGREKTTGNDSPSPKVESPRTAIILTKTNSFKKISLSSPTLQACDSISTSGSKALTPRFNAVIAASPVAAVSTSTSTSTSQNDPPGSTMGSQRSAFTSVNKL